MSSWDCCVILPFCTCISLCRGQAASGCTVLWRDRDIAFQPLAAAGNRSSSTTGCCHVGERALHYLGTHKLPVLKALAGCLLPLAWA